MFDRVLGLTMPWALKNEALEYSEKFGYPISPDAVTGRPNEQGQGDARDAFRHLYGTAVLAYEGGITPARDVAELGEVFGGNPELLAKMDRENNAIVIDIVKRVRIKFGGVSGATEQQIKDEIAREANEAIVSGKATFYTTLDNDADYTLPVGAPMSFREGEWDWMKGPGGAGSAAGIAGMDITRILGQISGGSGRGRKAMVMQSLLTSAAGLAREMGKSRRMSLESDLLDMFTGGRGRQGTPPFIGTGGTGGLEQSLFGALERVVGGALSRSKTTVSSSESARSVEAGKNWNLSQGQQQALLAQWAQAGAKNL